MMYTHSTFLEILVFQKTFCEIASSSTKLNENTTVANEFGSNMLHCLGGQQSVLSAPAHVLPHALRILWSGETYL